MITVIKYIVTGIATTVINILIYYILVKILNMSIYIGSTVSWLVAVIFAFFANVKFVFKEKTKNIKKAIILFFLLRIVSLLIEYLIMFTGVQFLKIEDLYVKIFATFIVIIINYFFSKNKIFK